MDPVFDKFMKHVEDLESWNEDWDHEFLTPTIVTSSVVVVIHPINEGPTDDPSGTGPSRISTAVATYTRYGQRISLFVYTNRRDSITHDYWAPPSTLPPDAVATGGDIDATLRVLGKLMLLSETQADIHDALNLAYAFVNACKHFAQED